MDHTTNTNNSNNGLPPKSPSSILGAKKFVLPSSTSRRRRKSSSKERRKSKSRSSSSVLQVDQALEDPTPQHLDLSTDSDDELSWSITDDFSMISFEQKRNSLPSSSTSSSSSSSSSSTDPFKDMMNGNVNKKTHHRKAHSWDSSDTYQQQQQGGGINNKVCLNVPKVFRRQKVMSADVASVSNASDTVVSVEEKGRITGRELHETAKKVLNAGEYDQAVMMFESLMKAQLDRFGEDHSSVGAAMHNVGVVRLRMGHHKMAEQVLVRATTIRRKVLGNDHLDLAVSLYSS